MARITNDAILSAVQETSRKIDEQNRILSAHGERLASIETSMESLIGNGQPGRISKLESAVDDLKESKWKKAGFMAAIAILFEPASHYVMHKIGLK